MLQVDEVHRKLLNAIVAQVQVVQSVNLEYLLREMCEEVVRTFEAFQRWQRREQSARELTELVVAFVETHRDNQHHCMPGGRKQGSKGRKAKPEDESFELLQGSEFNAAHVLDGIAAEIQHVEIAQPVDLLGRVGPDVHRPQYQLGSAIGIEAGADADVDGVIRRVLVFIVALISALLGIRCSDVGKESTRRGHGKLGPVEVTSQVETGLGVEMLVLVDERTERRIPEAAAAAAAVSGRDDDGTEGLRKRRFGGGSHLNSRMASDSSFTLTTMPGPLKLL